MKAEFDDLVIDLSQGDVDINQSPQHIYTSLNNQYLDSYRRGIIEAKLFDTDESLNCPGNPNYVKNYRRFLGFRFVHLMTLTGAGFLNPNYDITFCFDVEHILSQPHLICDHDLLAELLQYGTNHRIRDLFKDQYEMGDEVLVRNLNLGKAKRILTYSSKAQHELSCNMFLGQVEKIDLFVIRKAAIELQFK